MRGARPRPERKDQQPPDVVVLSQGQDDMRYVRVYTSPLTGKTMFDAMHRKGFRMLCEVVPGQPAEEICESIRQSLQTHRAGEAKALWPTIERVVKTFSRAAAGGRGMISKDMIGPDNIRSNWEVAKLLEFLNPRELVHSMSIGELEEGLRLHYRVSPPPGSGRPG